MYSILFLTLSMLLCCSVCIAQSYSFNKISNENGEENLSVRQTIQDKNGLLWLATFSGLYRFEGDEYIIQHQFDKKEEINKDVTSLAQDNNNNIWIGTNYGLSKYNTITEKLKTYNHHEDDSFSISDDKIRCVDIDKQGRIWIGTKEGGLNLYSPLNDGFIAVEFDSSKVVPPVHIKTILTGKDGRIWLGTRGNGLYCFTYSDSKVDSVCNYRMGDSDKNLTSNIVFCLFEDTDGKIAIGTKNGLNIYDPGTDRLTDYFSSQGLSNLEMKNTIRSILRDMSGKLWIGSWDGLRICDNYSDLETGAFDLLLHDRKNKYSISHDQILNVFQDKSRSVWIGTENGLNNFDPYQNQFHQIRGEAFRELKEQTATAFCSFKNGVLILTLSHGILCKNGDNIHTISLNTESESTSEKLYSLMVDSKNNIWIGSINGLLFKVDERTKLVSTYKHSQNKTSIYSLAELDNGKIILGTDGEGLKYFNPESEKFTNDNSLSGNAEINDILIDKNKNLWAATELGIFKKGVESTTFEYYLPDNQKNIPSANVFLEVAESEKGEIFVGGRNGFYKYDELSNTFKTMEFKNADNLWVTNIQFDSKQNIWLNLNFNRIAKWDRNIDQLQFFDVNNGTRNVKENFRGFYIDKNDELFLSGLDHIYQFNTSTLLENTFSPIPVFTKLVVNNTEVHVGTELNKDVILDSNIRFQKKIILNSHNKNFTLSFASTSFLNRDQNKYKYMLHGYDNNWLYTNEKSAHYTNLDPGSYTFEVFSSNNDGIWSENSAKLAIKVKPAPLLSLWAVMLYVLVGAISTFLIIKIVKARILLRRELLIERIKREKEESFHNERIRFYTNISHELRTPLTLIMGPVKQLINSDIKGTKNSALHQLIFNNSERLLLLVNQLLDFRKSNYEGMKLKVVDSDIVKLVHSNIEAFEYMAKEKFIDFKFHFEDSEVHGWFDLEKIDIILFNILSNAFKYTPNYGLVNVNMNTSPANTVLPHKHVVLQVTNTGKGIEKNLQKKVFERFFQVEESNGNINTGTGIGLSLVKNLVELHHGKVTLESELGKSTSFIVALPLAKEVYTTDEIFDFKRDTDRRTKELIRKIEYKNEISDFGKNKTIVHKLLIVEDNHELREYLSGFLSEEYYVFVAKDGIEGLQVCEKENPDLVISDVMMDNMDGLQFCKKLKSSPKISHIPVILMTALASVENKKEGYKTGADDYITKPFEPELLKIRVQNILKSRSKIKNEFGTNVSITTKELTISKIDEDFLNKVLDLIDQNIDNPDFDIKSFCKNLGVSSSQLYRKIKSITDVSPNEFIRTYRLKKAAEMVVETNLSISEIAFKNGFNDALYFSKCFKKQFGISPSKYLNRSQVLAN